MNYHLIRTDDMLNGDGIRVVLFVSGCEHYCNGCHNSETWDKNSGKVFDENAMEELLNKLDKSYISGLTLSGGDPLYPDNLEDILHIVCTVKNVFPDKTIWIYTGYTLDEIVCDEKNALKRLEILSKCNVLVEGKFVKELADVNYHWAGSTNQRVIYK